MIDAWGQVLFEASYGGVRIDVVTTDDDASRQVIEHEQPHTDGAVLEDTGARARRTACKIIFFQTSDFDDPRVRFDQITDLKDTGETYPFIHPIFGTYQAKITNFNVSMNAEDLDTFTVTCTFVEDSPADPVFSTGAGAPVDTGLARLQAGAAALTAALSQDPTLLTAGPGGTPLTSTVGAAAVSTVSGWTPDTHGIADARLELDAFDGSIQDEMVRFEVTTNNLRWPIFAALTNLAFAARQAFEAFVSSSPRSMEVTAQADMPLFVLLAQVYGAGDVATRYTQALQLNEIRNPARIPAGTTLTLLTPDTSRIRSAR